MRDVVAWDKNLMIRELVEIFIDTTSIELGGDDEFPFLRNTNGAAVQCPMMNFTQCDSIADVVVSKMLNRLDMTCVYAD